MRTSQLETASHSETQRLLKSVEYTLLTKNKQTKNTLLVDPN